MFLGTNYNASALALSFNISYLIVSSPFLPRGEHTATSINPPVGRYGEEKNLSMCHLLSVSKIPTSDSKTYTLLFDNVYLFPGEVVHVSSSMRGMLAFVFYRYEYCDDVRINK